MKTRFLATCSLILALGLVLPAMAQNSGSGSVGSGSVGSGASSVGDFQSNWAATKTEREAVKSALAAYLAAKKLNNEARKLELGKALLSKQLIVRQNALSKLQANLISGRCSKLGATDSASIKAQLKAVNDNLTSQTTEANQITASSQVKELSKQIIEENRVFVIVSPSIRGQCNSNLLIIKITTGVEPLVAKMVTLGWNTTKITGYLEDAKESAAKASALYRQAVDNRAQNPADLVNQANTLLQKAIDDLNLAAIEAKTLLSTSGTGSTAGSGGSVGSGSSGSGGSATTL